MHRILFVAAHRPGRSPSQRYRFEQFEPYWRQHGFTADHAWLISAKDDRYFYAPGNWGRKSIIFAQSLRKRWMHARGASRYDLIIVQREAFMTGSTYFERMLKRTGIPFVFDFDDAIWTMDVSEGNKKLSWLKSPAKTAALIAMADLVIAGNRYLADYAKYHNANVAVIPTTIDTESYTVKPARNDGPVNIVWTGSPTTIRHLNLAIPVLVQIKRKFGDRIGFTIIGDPSFKMAELGIQGQPWRPQQEVSDLSCGDIGIMPLPDDEWARGKCGLKGLQYMALGLPTLMSPVGVNTEIIQHGVNGFLPRTDEEWVELISRLVEDADLRARMGAEARRTVEERYSVKAWRDTYLKHFNNLVKQPKGIPA
ncbi:MAG: glycosyltransferase family 4 protein [Flavobacteriales bacterium]|nr:glycosyltransferase family 4 protein [Flavobacteriales bacterium]